MIHLGIDCGLNGAIVALRDREIIDKVPMPTASNGKSKEIDIQRLSLVLKYYAEQENFLTIEDTGGHAPSAAGLRSMTYSFAVTKTLAVVHKMPFMAILAVKWQRSFWTRPKMASGHKFDTKAAALKKACELFPNEDWRRTERSKIPFDGFVDAALIAEYGRRLMK